MSGFSATTFSFYGFLDHKGVSRASKLDDILNDDKLSILYESPHRLLKLLEELSIKEPSRTIFLAKEITKLHQKTYKNNALDLFKEFENINIRGEWVVVIQAKETIGYNLDLSDIQSLDIAPKIKAKLIAKMTGQSIKDVYQKLLEN